MPKSMLPICLCLITAALAGCGRAEPAQVTDAPMNSPAALSSAAPEETPLPESGTAASDSFLLDENAFCQVAITSGQGSADMDNDGVMETVSVMDNGENDGILVTVDRAGVPLSLHLPYLWNTSIYFADVAAGDGYYELFLNGDMASDDYATYMIRCSDGELIYTDIFATVLGGDGNGHLFTEEPVDVLGTYGSECWYALSNGFAFERCSPYTIKDWNSLSPDRALNVCSDGLIGTLADGSEMLLPSGTRLWLKETDASSYADAVTEDGLVVRLQISRSQESWAWILQGTAEDVWFNNLQYCG